MKTRNTSLIVALVLALGLLVSVPSANAGGPLNVNCAELDNTLILVDQVLTGAGFTCDNAGDLIGASFNDPAFFAQLQNVIFAVSGGTIFFDSPQQMVSTIAKCQLMTRLIEECVD